MLLKVVVAAIAIVLGDAAAARAAVELCPATASVAIPIGAAFGAAATQYAYDLEAATPRTVDATLIADTDKGWFKWSVSGVALANVTRVIPSKQFQFQRTPGTVARQTYTSAESPGLAVAFPMAVTIRHAWNVSANAGKGASPCDVPAFDGDKDKVPTKPDGSVAATPAPGYTAALATATTAPFAMGFCDFPFINGTVLKPVQPRPTLPTGAEMLLNGYATTIEVALDPGGRVIDAWIYASSGNAAFNRAALQAARASTYTGGVSYCRPVNSTYLFEATFTPD